MSPYTAAARRGPKSSAASACSRGQQLSTARVTPMPCELCAKQRRTSARAGWPAWRASIVSATLALRGAAPVFRSELRCDQRA